MPLSQARYKGHFLYNKCSYSITGSVSTQIGECKSSFQLCSLLLASIYKFSVCFPSFLLSLFQSPNDKISFASILPFKRLNCGGNSNGNGSIWKKSVKVAKRRSGRFCSNKTAKIEPSPFYKQKFWLDAEADSQHNTELNVYEFSCHFIRNVFEDLLRYLWNQT